jgi:toxin ParE1/3/4
MRVRYLARAREDLQRAAAFYDAERPGLGREFLRTVQDGLDTLTELPEAGTPYEEQTRRLILPRFPYSLIYQIDRDTILVVAVAHQRRKPGSWRGLE